MLDDPLFGHDSILFPLFWFLTVCMVYPPARQAQEYGERMPFSRSCFLWHAGKTTPCHVKQANDPNPVKREGPRKNLPSGRPRWSTGYLRIASDG